MLHVLLLVLLLLLVLHLLLLLPALLVLDQRMPRRMEVIREVREHTE